MSDNAEAKARLGRTSISPSSTTSYLAISVVLSLAALALAACGVSSTPVAAENREIPSLRELFPQASAVATTWAKDAHLIWAEVSALPTPVAVFAFNSVADPTKGALVYVDQPLGDPRVRLEEVSAPGRTEALPSIDLSDWGTLDSPSAYSIALEQGGREFLERNPSSRALWVRLQYVDRPDGGGITWRVTFGDPLAVTYDVLIEPSTGGVLQTEESP